MNVSSHALDTGSTVDFSTLLHANIDRVFNERDEGKRGAAMDELWAADALMYEADEVFVGHDDISRNITKLHERLPTSTLFTPIGPVIGHHGAAILRWSAAVPGEEAHVFGIDLAFVVGGRIAQLYVFLELR